MNTKSETTGLQDMKTSVKIKLAALWAALMFLYIYADHLSLFKTGQIEEMMAGRMGPLLVTQGSLLSASILMLIPAVMIFLSTALRRGVNRWANIVLGVLYTAVNVWNLVGEAWAFYIAFGVVEVALTVLIVWYAWKWRMDETR